MIDIKLTYFSIRLQPSIAESIHNAKHVTDKHKVGNEKSVFWHFQKCSQYAIYCLPRAILMQTQNDSQDSVQT